MGFRAIDQLVRAVVLIGGIALVVLVLVTGWQVWGRYVLNDTPTWAERLALLLILFVALPLGAVGLRENTHLGLSFATVALPKRVQKGIAVLNALILGAFGFAMTYYSYQLVEGTWNRAIPLLGVPQAFQYIPLCATGVLIVMFMAERLWFLLHPAYQSEDKGAN